MTEHEHIERAEQMARLADDIYRRSTHRDESGVDQLLRRAEVVARLAEMHFMAAAVRALTAEPPGSPRTAHTSRPSGLPDLPVTQIGDRR